MPGSWSCSRAASADCSSWEGFLTAAGAACGPGATTSVESPRTSPTFGYSAQNSPMTTPASNFAQSRQPFKTAPNSPHARLSFEVEPATDWKSGEQVSPFPGRCPRCQNFRSPRGEREIVEPLRTRGPRSISVVMEDTLRVQPEAGGIAGSGGRKALVFSDSRQDAAQLAGDIRRDHRYDVFRQLLYRILHRCRKCAGSGVLRV